MKFPTYKEIGEKVAEQALDEYVINGKTLREWIKLLSEQDPCDDVVSRQAVLEYFESRYPNNYADEPKLGGASCVFSLNCIRKALDELPSVRPQGPCDDAVSREMALKECHDIVIDGERYRVIQEETLLGLPPVRPQEPKICEKCLYAEEIDGSHCYECVKGESKFEPRPRTGHWIEEYINEWSRKIYCSECCCPPPFEHVSNGDVYSASGYGVTNKTRFCPSCGARMIESEE